MPKKKSKQQADKADSMDTTENDGWNVAMPAQPSISVTQPTTLDNSASGASKKKKGEKKAASNSSGLQVGLFPVNKKIKKKPISRKAKQRKEAAAVKAEAVAARIEVKKHKKVVTKEKKEKWKNLY